MANKKHTEAHEFVFGLNGVMSASQLSKMFDIPYPSAQTILRQYGKEKMHSRFIKANKPQRFVKCDATLDPANIDFNNKERRRATRLRLKEKQDEQDS